MNDANNDRGVCDYGHSTNHHLINPQTGFTPLPRSIRSRRVKSQNFHTHCSNDRPGRRKAKGAGTRRAKEDCRAKQKTASSQEIPIPERTGNMHKLPQSPARGKPRRMLRMQEKAPSELQAEVSPTQGGRALHILRQPTRRKSNGLPDLQRQTPSLLHKDA